MYGDVGPYGGGAEMSTQAALAKQQAMGMNMAGGVGMNMGIMGLGMPMNIPANTFFFTGNSLSLMARLDSTPDQQFQRYVDATIVVSGNQIQAMNMCSYLCTVIWASILIFPIFFLCMDCWKRCTFPAFSIDINIYQSIARIIRGTNLKNITLRVIDNTFNQAKAGILYNALMESRTRGFTFVNLTGEYDFQGREYSDFEKNMRPIKNMTNIISDIRWSTTVVM